MAQPAGFTKNPLSIIPFCEKAPAEPPLEWSKWAAIVEMAISTKDGIDVRNFLRDKLELVDPPEPVLEVETTGETDAQRNQKSRKTLRMGKPMPKCEKGFLSNSVPWEEADA